MPMQAMFDSLRPELTLCSLPAHGTERVPEHMETSILFMGARSLWPTLPWCNDLTIHVDTPLHPRGCMRFFFVLGG